MIEKFRSRKEKSFGITHADTLQYDLYQTIHSGLQGGRFRKNKGIVLTRITDSDILVYSGYSDKLIFKTPDIKST